jgi:hypothetical protein
MDTTSQVWEHRDDHILSILRCNPPDILPLVRKGKHLLVSVHDACNRGSYYCFVVAVTRRTLNSKTKRTGKHLRFLDQIPLNAGICESWIESSGNCPIEDFICTESWTR